MCRKPPKALPSQSSELSAPGRNTECAPPASEAQTGGALTSPSRTSLQEFCTRLCGEEAGEAHGNA